MLPTTTPSPDVLAEARRQARAQIDALRAAPTLAEADDLYGEALVALCVARSRGELDRPAHDALARETIWAHYCLTHPADYAN
ncbi:hypothetical protein ACUVZD_000084 [Pseudomonas aeruginosa]